MGHTKKNYYPMRGCSLKKRSSLVGGYKYNGTYNQNPVRMYYGPQGPNPGWISPSMQRGGRKQSGGNNGLPFGKHLAPMKAPIVPNGHTGSTWRPNFKWPGTDLVQGNYNYFPLNKYINDVSRAMKDIGAGFPFLKGGSKRRSRRRSRSRSRSLRQTKGSLRQRGGVAWNNTIASDIKNGIGGAMYNNDKFVSALAGSSKQPMNPDPTYQPYLGSKMK